MYPQPIAHYHAPRSVGEALELIAHHGAEATILAGGQSLLQELKARRRAPPALVDINRIDTLGQVELNDDRVRLGALLRLAVAARDPQVCRHGRALAEAAATVGDRQVRNRGTLVGNIACGAHYGDIAPAAAVLDACLSLSLATGATRELSVEDYVAAVREPAVAPSLITALSVPPAPSRSGSCYLKHGRVSQDRATVGVAAWLTRGTDGRCAAVRIAIGGLASSPVVRASAVEAAVIGASVDAALLERAGRAAATSLATQDDELASADYRRQLLAVYVPRALQIAWARSGEASA